MSIFISELIGAILQVVFFSLIPLIWWLATARKNEKYAKWIGLKKVSHNGKVLITILITLAVVLIYGFMANYFVAHFVGEVTSAGSEFAGKGLVYIPVAFVYGYIRTGMAEEILFRGFILKRVRNKFGFIVGNTVQAILFGLIHGIPFGIVTNNILVTIALTILPGLLGFCMGWLNEKKCDGSLIPSWLIHGTINTIVTCLSL